ncbi:MAG: hypothetical protein BZY79_06065 [SAR202 cluster bacterium Casp-Chloro-G4]|nr:DUF1385 domain-containing protein [Chloroflexota bacterium]MDA1227578.1 DUF1385 domain-containing protein [Chloroflexota bacterium]PKB61014.1 MAG: hypothetical protein BZY79_06065 [SAR202 cluster bacterium Casp-Chloro-G4]
MSAQQGHTYGGQAVIEGVMIRGQKNMAVAVRRHDGSIAVQCLPLSAFFTGNLRRIPLVRGIITLAETLTLGMRALSYSANVGMESEGEEIGKGSIALMMVLSLTIAIGLFFLLPLAASWFLEGVLGSSLAANVAEGVIRLALFVGYILLIGQMNDIKRVFMYHGAEHMTVHAQERGDPLEVEYIRKYSTAHPRCGTAFLLVVMVLAIVAFIFVGREPLWWLFTSRVVLIPVIASVSYEVIRWSGRYSGNSLVGLITGPSLALQALTTKEPDDDQIEIAIAAMNSALEADRGVSPTASE